MKTFTKIFCIVLSSYPFCLANDLMAKTSNDHKAKVEKKKKELLRACTLSALISQFKTGSEVGNASKSSQHTTPDTSNTNDPFFVSFDVFNTHFPQ